MPPITSPNSDLFSFAYLGHLATRMTTLSSLAAPEPLLFDRQTDGSRPFLVRFLCDRFQLARQQELIFACAGGRTACTFDTGLVTPLREPIFAVFVPNRARGPQPWFLSDFATPGSRGLSRFAALPASATPWHEVSELAFEPELDWRPFLDHLVDAKHRAYYPREWQSLGRLELANRVTFGIAYSRVQCARDGALIVPQLHQGRIGFFAPLYSQGQEHPDLALVLEPQPGHYRVSTVYPLEWAFPLARIVSRPASWLVCSLRAKSPDAAA